MVCVLQELQFYSAGQKCLSRCFTFSFFRYAARTDSCSETSAIGTSHQES